MASLLHFSGILQYKNSPTPCLPHFQEFFFSVKGRPSGPLTQLAVCLHGKRETLGSSPGRATIVSSPVTFGG